MFNKIYTYSVLSYVTFIRLSLDYIRIRKGVLLSTLVFSPPFNQQPAVKSPRREQLHEKGLLISS